MEIRTDRLLLRQVNQTDSRNIFEYRSDQLANKYQGWVPESIKDVNTFIEKNANSFNEENSWFQFVVITRVENRIVGDVGVHFFDSESKQVELGCTINKLYHQKGYAKESLKSVISILFEKYDKRRIIGSVDPKNTPSIKLLESLKFTKEAHFRKSLFFKDEWVDDVVFAILKDEWR